MSEPILQVEELTKDFGPYRAVDKVSFSVPKGKIIGLLGPNGAGKTTTIHMLLGVVDKTSGSIKYFGKEFEENRVASLSKLNFASSFNTLQGRISVLENLKVYAALYGIKNPDKKIDELIKMFEVEDLIHQKFWNLSAGQKTRVILAKAMLNDPELILMDEPTASLDPHISDKLLSVIEKLKKQKELSILYTSHDMQEVTRICDEVIFLHHGKIVAHDTPLSLTMKIKDLELVITFDSTKEAVSGLLMAHKIRYTFDSGIRVRIKTSESQIPKILSGFDKVGIRVASIEIEKPDLEDVFLDIARGSYSTK